MQGPRLKRGFVLAVSAPSGTGKTSLCDKLAEDDSLVVRSISATTRPRRQGEIHKKDYEFLSRDEFMKRRRAGDFLETAEVFGNWYGSPKKPVERALKTGKSIIMDIDVVGALNIRRLYPKDSVLVFILPPSLKELENRLRGRGKNSDSELKMRLKEARYEISQSHLYDYVFVNSDFGDAYQSLQSIVRAERSKVHRLKLQYRP